MEDNEAWERDDDSGLPWTLTGLGSRFRVPRDVEHSQESMEDEVIMACPYDPAHVTTNKKCLMHYINCRKEYKVSLAKPEDCKIHVCPYDCSHHIKEADFGLHVLECTKRDLRTDLRNGVAEGIRVPHLGPRRGVRLIEKSHVLTGLMAKIRGAADGKTWEDHKQSTKYFDGNKDSLGLADLAKVTDFIWADECNSSKVLPEAYQQSEQTCSTAVEIWEPQVRTPEASPPKDVEEIEKIDYYADFEKELPLFRCYHVEQTWSGENTHIEEIPSSDLDTTDFITEDEADFGEKKQKKMNAMCLSSSMDTVGGSFAVLPTLETTETEPELRVACSNSKGVDSIGLDLEHNIPRHMTITSGEEADVSGSELEHRVPLRATTNWEEADSSGSDLEQDVQRCVTTSGEEADSSGSDFESKLKRPTTTSGKEDSSGSDVESKLPRRTNTSGEEADVSGFDVESSVTLVARPGISSGEEAVSSGSDGEAKDPRVISNLKKAKVNSSGSEVESSVPRRVTFSGAEADTEKETSDCLESVVL